MKRFVCHFRRDEGGAVTSDWVVISAGIVLFSAATVFSVRTYAVALGPAISEEIDRQMN